MRFLILTMLLIFTNTVNAYCNWEWITKDRTSMKVVNKFNQNRTLYISIGDRPYAQAVGSVPTENIVSVDDTVMSVRYNGLYMWFTRENTEIARSFGAIDYVLIFVSDRSIISDDIADILENCDF